MDKSRSFLRIGKRALSSACSDFLWKGFGVAAEGGSGAGGRMGRAGDEGEGCVCACKWLGIGTVVSVG